MIDLSKKVGPFAGVSADATRTFPNGESFRFLVYGAYNAGGLIGPESNGVAILKEDPKSVLVDQLDCATTGYHGPSAAQNQLFERLQAPDFTFNDLCALVNESPRAREQLTPDASASRKPRP